MSTSSLYVVESHSFEVRHNGRASHGVVGEHKGSEKIFLHVLPLSDADIARLATRVDEHGNKQSDRFAIPHNDDFWLSLDGEVLWPSLPRAKIRSRVQFAGRKVVPVALTETELAALRGAGVVV
jgi:hypothetical protein